VLLLPGPAYKDSQPGRKRLRCEVILSVTGLGALCTSFPVVNVIVLLSSLTWHYSLAATETSPESLLTKLSIDSWMKHTYMDL
jgi:hypothetical protein